MAIIILVLSILVAIGLALLVSVYWSNGKNDDFRGCENCAFRKSISRMDSPCPECCRKPSELPYWKPRV